MEGSDLVITQNKVHTGNHTKFMETKFKLCIPCILTNSANFANLKLSAAPKTHFDHTLSLGGGHEFNVD